MAKNRGLLTKSNSGKQSDTQIQISRHQEDRNLKHIICRAEYNFGVSPRTATGCLVYMALQTSRLQADFAELRLEKVVRGHGHFPAITATTSFPQASSHKPVSQPLINARPRSNLLRPTATDQVRLHGPPFNPPNPSLLNFLIYDRHLYGSVKKKKKGI